MDYPGAFSPLCEGIQIYGILSGIIGPPPYRTANNYLIADPRIITASIASDLELSRIEIPRSPPTLILPLDLVPKSTRGWRRIHDLS